MKPLRQTITVERWFEELNTGTPAMVITDAGTPYGGWQPILTLRASVDYTGTAEIVDRGAKPALEAEVRIWWTGQITMQDRVVWSGGVWAIQRIGRDGRHMLMTIRNEGIAA
ncbi:MAG: head-tail adaptor protein [Tabrizicola sp.]